MLKRAGQIALGLLVLGFLLGLGRFLYFRFSSGELYPEYSSFRADPLGTKAFFESLRGLKKISVARHVESVRKLKPDSQTALLFLGSRGLSASPNGLPDADNLARSGARVFVALNAIGSSKEEREQDRIERGREKGEKEVQVPTEFSGIRVRLIDPLRRNTNQIQALRVSDKGGPESIAWFGRYCFEVGTNGWETIYEAKHKPVVLQKKTGLGVVILCADTFLFSNEALARERSPEFLLWAIGPARRVVFDEAHLGIQRGSSIMTVVREYRLQGLFFGLLAVASLWIWKNSSTFVPPYAQELSAESEPVEGKTAREGVVHLLEQNLSADELPAICLREWSKSHPHPTALDVARLKEAEAALGQYARLPKKERNPLAIYGRITHILSPSKN